MQDRERPGRSDIMSSVDKIYEAFIESQNIAAAALNQASDIVEITPKQLKRGHLYAVRMLCRGLVNEGGKIKDHDQFELLVHFPEHYLRRCSPVELICWVSPATVWHPNIKPPFLCLGRLTPGMKIVDIVHQAYEIVSYQKVTMVESDALNHDAAVWARANLERFPVDTRPLRRRIIEFTLEEIRKGVQE
jgi:hypothetical protein